MLHSLMTNLNWASLNLPTPLLHSEIVSSTLSASFQHPLTPKHANTPSWAVGRWQMLAVRERGWVSFWMNVKALVKRRAWALHCLPADRFLTASSNPQMLKGTASPSPSSEWLGGGRCYSGHWDNSPSINPACGRMLSPSPEQAWGAVGTKAPGLQWTVMPAWPQTPGWTKGDGQSVEAWLCPFIEADPPTRVLRPSQRTYQASDPSYPWRG